MNKVLVVLCFILLVVAAWPDDDNIQQVATGPRGQDLADGTICSTGDECASKCCLKQFTVTGSDGPAQCHVKSDLGESCSDDQVKGGASVNHCPCSRGSCENNICTLENTDEDKDD
ncbi:U-scoloptoxin(18)-Er1a-like [Ixodes scapularis]|uniref:U-scoloptoxin(18)-Er1a-like n=1 Tax=Ixodes scapularis TaxID=6945 RepID=UPI001A9FDEC7|nr:U-scoloptoxin(18)-Er1a-like [Ixodes scapularis]